MTELVVAHSFLDEKSQRVTSGGTNEGLEASSPRSKDLLEQTKGTGRT